MRTIAATPVVLAVCLGACLGACGGHVAGLTTKVAPDKAVAADDEEFRRVVRQVALERHDLLSGWGTVRLDDRPTTYRFATIEPGQDGPGTYVIGDVKHRFWLVHYPHDGRTQAFANQTLPTGVTEPAWRFATADQGGGVGIEHLQNHHHGGDTLTFGVHDSALVVFWHSGVDDVTENRTPKVETFATSGACTPTCPPLGGYDLGIDKFVVRGPFATSAELIDAARTGAP